MKYFHMDTNAEKELFKQYKETAIKLGDIDNSENFGESLTKLTNIKNLILCGGSSRITKKVFEFDNSFFEKIQKNYVEI